MPLVASMRAADREQLSAALASVGSLKAWCSARETAFVSAMNKVSSFPEHDIADAGRTDIKTATKLMERAATADQFPAVAEGAQDGAVTADHIDTLARAARSMKPEQRSELTQRDAELAVKARTSTPEQFAVAVRSIVRQIEADDGTERLGRQRRNNRLHGWIDKETGMYRLSGQFDPASGLIIDRALREGLARLFATAVPDDCPTDPQAKQDWLRAQTLVQLLTTVGTTARSSFDPIVVVDASAPCPGARPTVDWGIPIEVPFSVRTDRHRQSAASVLQTPPPRSRGRLEHRPWCRTATHDHAARSHHDDNWPTNSKVGLTPPGDRLAGTKHPSDQQQC